VVSGSPTKSIKICFIAEKNCFYFVLFQYLQNILSLKEMEGIKDSQKVLLIWSGVSPPQDLEQIVGRMTQLAGSGGKVNVEHIDRLKLCKLLKI
jgi:hypothetical protein